MKFFDLLDYLTIFFPKLARWIALAIVLVGLCYKPFWGWLFKQAVQQEQSRINAISKPFLEYVRRVSAGPEAATVPTGHQ